MTFYLNKFDPSSLPTPFICVIIGPCGCGKTRTAMEIAKTRGEPIQLVAYDEVDRISRYRQTEFHPPNIIVVSDDHNLKKTFRELEGKTSIVVEAQAIEQVSEDILEKAHAVLVSRIHNAKLARRLVFKLFEDDLSFTRAMNTASSTGSVYGFLVHASPRDPDVKETMENSFYWYHATRKDAE